MELQAVFTPPDPKSLIADLVYRDKVADYSVIPTYQKLAVCQILSPKMIKKRQLTSKVTVPYLEHYDAEKMLNFVFNFHVSAEILKVEKKSGKTQSGKPYIEAEVQMRFTFFDNTSGREIKKDIVTGHKGFLNDAITEADIVKSAVSKGYTVVARQFGIGANLVEQEKRAYERIRKFEQQQKPEVKVETPKAFVPDANF